MEDRDSLDRVARLWGRKTAYCGTSSTGSKVWRVQIGGEKAKELLGLMVPCLAGPKRAKAPYLLAEDSGRTSLPVKRCEDSVPFGEMR